MDPKRRIRRFVATEPFLAAEVTLLAVVVGGTVGFVALASAGAPVSLLWAAVTVTVVAAAVLPVAMVAHGAVDLWRLVRADGWPSAASAFLGLWRTGEVATAATFFLFAAGAALLATDLNSPELASREARATLGVWVGFSALFAALAEGVLVAAVATRVVLVVAIGDGDAEE